MTAADLKSCDRSMFSTSPRLLTVHKNLGTEELHSWERNVVLFLFDIAVLGLCFFHKKYINYLSIHYNTNQCSQSGNLYCNACYADLAGQTDLILSREVTEQPNTVDLASLLLQPLIILTPCCL